MFPKLAKQLLQEELDALSADRAAVQRDVLAHTWNREHLLSVDKDDLDVFRLSRKLYHYGYLTREQKEELLVLLKKVHALLKSNKFADISNSLRLLSQVEAFLEHQESYLDFVPGVDGKQYFRASDLFKSKSLVINKVRVDLAHNLVLRDGKSVQGLKIYQNGLQVVADIVADHFSGEEAIRDAYSRRRVLAGRHRLLGGRDPFVYLAETGRLRGMPEGQIKKVLGARQADSSITVRMQVPLHHLWLRIHSGEPVKFAIEAKEVPFSAPKQQRGFSASFRGKSVRLAA